MRSLTKGAFNRALKAFLISVFLCCFHLTTWAAELTPLEKERIQLALPSVTKISDTEGKHKVRSLYNANDELLAYAFQTINVVNIPAYSGKTINLQVVMDLKGNILDAYVLFHDEPILLIGIPEKELHDFAAKYTGINAEQRVVIGKSKDDKAITIDAVSGATVTVMVLNEIVMRSAHQVAADLGLVDAIKDIRTKRAVIKQEEAVPTSWTELVGDGSIRRMLLTKGEVDVAFVGTEAEGVEEAEAHEKDEALVDLYIADLTVPKVGKSILGQDQYARIMEDIQPGDHAIMVVANGDYSFKGSGYVRGGIFDRIQMRQFGDIISFRDVDYYRLSDVYAENMPRFTEMGIFIVRNKYELDPGQPWDFELLVRRQTGPVSSIFISFDLSYLTPEIYWEVPPLTKAELAAIKEANMPLWVKIWYQKSFQIGVIGLGLIILVGILFFQDYLVRRPKLLYRIRAAYLSFTLFFIGWYMLGQLSVVNVLTFIHALISDFHWSLFLSDPVIFILWSFTAFTILLWGRGVFCGWLCPFGALQELLNEIARKLKIPQYNVPFLLHERLWTIKYIILLVLFGVSLDSLATAEKLAEIEPFKTSITLRFGREWWFVLYAAILLVINLFTRKVYCRYICPLGAALAVPTKLRLFDWLKRRKECGKPCQICAIECEVQAIHPDGYINPNECHHCLDCQITYYDDEKCPPLVSRKRKQAKSEAVAQFKAKNAAAIPVVEVN